MTKKSMVSLLITTLVMVSLFAACAPQVVTQVVEKEVVVTQVVQQEGKTVVEVVTATPEAEKTFKAYAVFAAIVEEPWDGVIHAALKQAAADGKVTYDMIEEVGYSGDMERVLNEVAEQQKPDLIFGDAFGNEELVRNAAANNPDLPFIFGSALGPSDPNLSVFDNWIHEPAYLAGMLAGGLTKTNTIGIVGGYPVGEVNRLVWAFTKGAQEINPEVKVLVTFLNSWFDPAAAKEATLAQIDNGADVFYAERFGVIEAAAEHNMYVFGNMSDQNELAPEWVISSVCWNMTPTVDYVLSQVHAGSYTSQDLKDFSMWAKGGSYLADFHGNESKVPTDVMDKVLQRQDEIAKGLFRVDINEGQPPAVIEPGQ